MVYGCGETSQNQISQASLVNNQQQVCYTTNYFVVNIDGPINFNATHSLQDDGSDLPFNDINTIRFFYNLGIEVIYILSILSNFVYFNLVYLNLIYLFIVFYSNLEIIN